MCYCVEWYDSRTSESGPEHVIAREAHFSRVESAYKNSGPHHDKPKFAIMSPFIDNESPFSMTTDNKEESVMTMEENCSDTSPGITVANEEFDDVNQKSLCDCCGRVNRRSNGSVTFWVLAILTVLVVAGGTLTAVILASRNKDPNDSSTATDGSPEKQSEAYYQERFEIFRQVAGRVSTSEAQIQSDSPSSKALDWMVYHDTTIPHELLLQGQSGDASTNAMVTQFFQRYAIMVLYFACGGEEWQGFVSPNIEQQGHIDTCLWDDDDFVACNDLNEVVELKLDFRRLGGTLPLELRALTSLETLDMSYNFLDGTVPNELFQDMNNLSKFTGRRAMKKVNQVFSDDLFACPFFQYRELVSQQQ